MMSFGDYMNVKILTCIGGKSIGDDLKALESGVQVVSGTPGRVYDMIQRQSLKVKHVKMLVIDEADEMLSKGFKEQLYSIYRHLPPQTQIVLVSATLPNDVLDVSMKFMHDPVRILVKRDELTLEGNQ
jgi:ATP-dependent RNA helicase